MWNKKIGPASYRSLFLFIRIRSGRFRLTLPIALFLLDETFEILAELFWLVQKLMPGCHHHFNKKQDFPVDQFIEISREFLGEMRRYGRYPLVEVETGEGIERQHIVIEFF